jgi:hypothetical protein
LSGFRLEFRIKESLLALEIEIIKMYKKRCIEWYIAHHAPHTKIGLSISTGTSATRTVSITESFHHVAEGDCFVYYYLLQLPMVI